MPKMIHYQDEVQTQRKDKENVLRELSSDYFNLS